MIAPAAFFDSRSYSLERLFGYAVCHAFARQGGSYIHGAAFELDRQGLLILGLSCGGKSTLSALALRAGARVISDDTLLVSRDRAGNIHAEAVRDELYLREPTQTLLPEALRAILKPTRLRGEHRWVLDRSLATSFARRLRPTRILCTAIDRRLKATRVSPMAKPAVLAELMRAASPLFLSNGYPLERAAMMPALMQLAMGVSGFRVRLGQDLFAAPDDTFRRLLDATAGASESGPGLRETD